MSGLLSFRAWLSSNRYYAIGGAVAALVVLGALAGADHYSRLAEEKDIKIRILNEKLADTDSQRLRALALADEAKHWSDVANARVVELQKQLALKPMPPKPPPAPATSLELSQVIVKFGLMENLTVLEESRPSILGRSDSLKVYEWASQAARVAPLEDRISGQGALIEGLQSQVGAVGQELYLTKTALVKTTDQLILTQEQSKLISAQAKAAAKKAAIQKWLYAGGAVVTGYLVGRK